jgi:hypothetical protein
MSAYYEVSRSTVFAVATITIGITTSAAAAAASAALVGTPSQLRLFSFFDLSQW